MQFVFACSPLKCCLRKKPMDWKLYLISPSPQKSHVCTLKTNQQRHCQTPHLSHFSMLLTQANWPIWNRPINKMMGTAQHCEGELGPCLYVCYTTAFWKLSLWFWAVCSVLFESLRTSLKKIYFPSCENCMHLTKVPVSESLAPRWQAGGKRGSGDLCAA